MLPCKKNPFRPTSLLSSLLLGALLGAGCQAVPGWSNAEALHADSLEMQLDDTGRPLEIEYHVPPGDVPPDVRAAMDALHPGGRATAAEKEYVGGTLFWEVTKEIDGREVEAMFRPDGALHSEEIEVPEGDVPPAVVAAVHARLAGTITKWEEIRDGQRRLVEYHAKLSAGDRKYKVVASTQGSVLRVVREIPAELEIPLP